MSSLTLSINWLDKLPHYCECLGSSDGAHRFTLSDSSSMVNYEVPSLQSLILLASHFGSAPHQCLFSRVGASLGDVSVKVMCILPWLGRHFTYIKLLAVLLALPHFAYLYLCPIGLYHSRVAAYLHHQRFLQLSTQMALTKEICKFAWFYFHRTSPVDRSSVVSIK